MKSSTCTGPNGQFLSEYHSKYAAEQAAEESRERYRHDLVPYLCHGCNYWHLTTGTTRKQCHFCTDSSLFLKDIYSTKEEAMSTTAWLMKEKRIQLYPYRCPHSGGWHLTKTDPGRKKKG